MRMVSENTLAVRFDRRSFPPMTTLEATYYYTARSGTVYWETNPDNMVDGNASTRAKTTSSNRRQRLTENNLPEEDLGPIDKIEIRFHTYGMGGTTNFYIHPVLDDVEGDTYTTVTGNGQWSDYIDITGDVLAAMGWNWSTVKRMDLEIWVNPAGGGSNCSRVEIRVTYRTFG